MIGLVFLFTQPLIWFKASSFHWLTQFESDIDFFCISLFPCRRRLSTVLVRLKFCEHLKEAITYIQQGHVRVGPETVTDPAFLVTRNMEDFVTWVDSSKIKRKVLQYNDQLDDYDAMT